MVADEQVSPEADGLTGRFPPDFRWSAATAAFQVEGARTAGGRGRSIWDEFVETPGRVLDGSRAEPGPDSFHRWRDDIGLLAELGVDSYRFSISWVRVVANGTGELNTEGLDYYSRLIDGLLEAGIEPVPTLYHWDLPQPLESDGGWLNRRTAEHFTTYVEHVAAAFSDRVDRWYTINEPVSTTLEGYAIGELAPGHGLLFDALPTVHHQLLAHGWAAQILHASGANRVGIVNNHTHVRGLHETDGAAVAAYDALHNRIFADPVLTGEYPNLAAVGLPDMPIEPGDLEVISTPCEVYGLNFYNPMTVTSPAADSPIPFDLVETPGAPVTGFGAMWPIVPDALRDLLVDFADRYDALPPIAIAENGAAFPEADRVDAPIKDRDRIDYLRGHIQAVAAAIDAGVKVDEYTVWSLIDNFEWAAGFTQRFGVVHVDMESGTRTPKASYDWYRDLIARSRVSR